MVPPDDEPPDDDPVEEVDDEDDPEAPDEEPASALAGTDPAEHPTTTISIAATASALRWLMTGRAARSRPFGTGRILRDSRVDIGFAMALVTRVLHGGTLRVMIALETWQASGRQ